MVDLIVMVDLSRREHLINISLNLFNQYGYHGVGIDLILKDAKVSKKTMYKYFRSKQELIVAVLEKQDSLLRSQLINEVDDSEKVALAYLEKVFHVFGSLMKDNNFYGCMFVSAVSEYPEVTSPIRDISQQFKASLHDYILDLCKKSQLKTPQLVAAELSMLIDGAVAIAQVTPNTDASGTLQRAANNIIAFYKLT